MISNILRIMIIPDLSNKDLQNSVFKVTQEAIYKMSAVDWCELKMHENYSLNVIRNLYRSEIKKQNVVILINPQIDFQFLIAGMAYNMRKTVYIIFDSPEKKKYFPWPEGFNTVKDLNLFFQLIGTDIAKFKRQKRVTENWEVIHAFSYDVAKIIFGYNNFAKKKILTLADFKTAGEDFLSLSKCSDKQRAKIQKTLDQVNIKL